MCEACFPTRPARYDVDGMAESDKRSDPKRASRSDIDPGWDARLREARRMREPDDAGDSRG